PSSPRGIRASPATGHKERHAVALVYEALAILHDLGKLPEHVAVGDQILAEGDPALGASGVHCGQHQLVRPGAGNGDLLGLGLGLGHGGLLLVGGTGAMIRTWPNPWCRSRPSSRGRGPATWSGCRAPGRRPARPAPCSSTSPAWSAAC